MISKSNYVNGLRCQKLLWLNIHKRKLKKEASAQDQARFDTGNEVGELATQLFPACIIDSIANLKETYTYAYSKN